MTLPMLAVPTVIHQLTIDFYATLAGGRYVLPNVPLPDPDCDGIVKAVKPVGNFFVSQLLGLASAYWWWWVVALIATLAGGLAAFKAGKKIIGSILLVFGAGLLLIIIVAAPEAFFPVMKNGC